MKIFRYLLQLFCLKSILKAKDNKTEINNEYVLEIFQNNENYVSVFYKKTTEILKDENILSLYLKIVNVLTQGLNCMQFTKEIPTVINKENERDLYYVPAYEKIYYGPLMLCDKSAVNKLLNIIYSEKNKKLANISNFASSFLFKKKGFNILQKAKYFNLLKDIKLENLSNHNEATYIFCALYFRFFIWNDERYILLKNLNFFCSEFHIDKLKEICDELKFEK